MKISIESTAELTEIDGVPVRVWHGITEGGVQCLVFVHRLAVSISADASQFDQELITTIQPRALEPFPASMDPPGDKS